MNNLLYSHIDPNKIFIINRSEIEGRLDSNQYHPERMRMIEKLKHTNTICVLKSVVDFSKNITSEIKDSDIYVGLENILSDTGEYIQTTDKQTISTAAIFRKGQILFPKLRPYLNKVFLANFDGICSTEFHVLSVRKGVLAEFLHIYLLSDIVVKQTKHLMTGNTLPRLQTDDIYNLPVPIIPIEEQQKIVDLYQSAFQLKQQKEAQVTALLASIDDYLLGELGITLPEQNNCLQSRMFRTQFSKIAGRLDPLYFKNINQKIEGGIFINYPLKEVAIITKGQSITKDKVIEGDFPVVAGGQTSPYNHNEYNAAGNCITVSASGAYSGYVWYHENPIFASDCSVIRSINEQFITTIFLYEALKLKQSEIYKLQQGAGQPHVYPNDLAKLNIPLPPLEKQNEIAEHIQSIRNQVRNLQKEAQEILEKAKKEVEQIILGE